MIQSGIKMFSINHTSCSLTFPTLSWLDLWKNAFSISGRNSLEKESEYLQPIIVWLLIQGKIGINQKSPLNLQTRVKYKNTTEDKTQKRSGITLLSDGELEKAFNRRVDMQTACIKLKCRTKACAPPCNCSVLNF